MSNRFVEIAMVKLSSKRTLVISDLVPEGDSVIIGQKLSLKDENDKQINMFLKGALNIPKESVYDLRDALNDVIKYLENKNK